ncbi:uncharacterized protein [Phaseolus vulgaris]|uniref:uncharacterized protein n=1 Tax=Phaseolus vulgaris TaxID=3885 RepID=UPI0035CC0D99
MEDPPSASTPYISAGGGPPSNASPAEVAPIGDEVAHTSPILITESPIPSPRQQAPTEEPAKEGGDENQQQAPTAPLHAANLPLKVTRMWEPLSAKLKTIADDIPAVITRAVEGSTRKLQDDLFNLKTENSTMRVELIKADAVKVQKLEKRSADRETLLGQVEKARDDAIADLAEANEEKGKVAVELAQVQAESKKVAEDLLQAQETNEQLKKQVEELDQQNKELKEQTEDLKKRIEELQNMVSLNNEVVDGKVVPAED